MRPRRFFGFVQIVGQHQKLFLVITLITQLQSHRLKVLENFLEGSPTVGYGLSGAGVFRLAAGGEKNGKRKQEQWGAEHGAGR